ncbi:hypothetical protein [Actinocorallia lasiicapitis]
MPQLDAIFATSGSAGVFDRVRLIAGLDRVELPQVDAIKTVAGRGGG